jgi:hypothetical protein
MASSAYVEEARSVLLERRDLRSRRTKTFEVVGWRDWLGRKRYRTVAGVDPLHWKDAAGHWRDVDLRWTQHGTWFAITEAPYQAWFDPSTFTLRYLSRTKGDLRMRLVSIDGQPPTPVTPQPFFTGDRMRIADIGSGVSLVLVAHPHGPEFYRYIAGPTLPTLVWEFDQSEDLGDVRTNVFNMGGNDNHGDFAADRRAEALPRNQRRIVEVVVERSPDVVAHGRRSHTVLERLTGRTKWRDPKTRTPEWRGADELRFPVFLDVQVIEDVVATDDDGHGITAPLWYSAITMNYLTNLYLPAWRFQTVDVPAGATIDSASLRVEVVISGNYAATLYGENVDDAAIWTNNSANSPTAMAATTANTAFTGFGTTGQKTFDVKTIIAEIVARPGWAANQDIRLGAKTPTGGANVVKFIATGYGSGTVGRLTIDYTAGGGGSAPMFRGA